jgi:hypothetical protein
LGAASFITMTASCAISTHGQNANRCASFVSADTGLHGLFRPKIAEMAETDDATKTKFMLILKGFYER